MPIELSVSALAREVGLSERTIRKLADGGVVVAKRNLYNHRVFDAGAVAVLKARANKIRARERAALNRKEATK